MVQSSTVFLAAFWSLIFQEAAPGKVAHESLMNSILFNTRTWATALSSCIAQAKCHDPRGSRDSTARSRLAGSRGPHDLWSRVHHHTSYSVTETWRGCCNTDEHCASYDTCSPCCKAVRSGHANTGKSTAASVGTLTPCYFPPPPLLPFPLLHALKKFTVCHSLPFCFRIFMLCCFCSPIPFP